MDFKLKKSNLNFHVYTADSLPDTGNENDICVISDVSMKNWIMSPDTPNGAPRNDGDIWIRYSAAGDTLNILKNNTMRICISSLKQYIGGEWVDQTAKRYQNGEWVDLRGIIYLYKNGNAFDDITGGLEALAISGSFWKSSDVTFDSDRIIFNSTPNTACVSYATTKKKIDLTNRNSIVLNSLSFTATGQYAKGKLGVTSTKTDYTSLHDNAVAFKEFGTGTTGEVILDISSLSGEYYVAFGISSESSGGRLEVSEVRIE